MYMAGFSAVIAAAFILSGCTTLPYQPQSSGTVETMTASTIVADNTSPLTCSGARQYTPLPAFAATNYTDYTIADGKVKATNKDWPKTNEEINKLLPNIASQIAVRKLSGSAEIGPFAKGQGRAEQVTIDFMKYRSEAVEDNGGKIVMYSRIGAGLRLTIDLVTADASLGTGSLLAIAISAKAGQTRGTINADIIGMDASDITMAMPFTSDVSEGSIQKIIEALAVIKAKLHEGKTKLSPQFIAKIDCVTAKA
jgi:hypothetical protein